MDKETLSKINEQLSRYMPYKLDFVDPGEIIPVKKNARYMDDKTFKKLVQNIKQDKNLSSVPFCVKENGRYTVLSGNHRVEAAKAAGIEKILILYDDRQLSKSQMTAIQLSHNALTGKDDLTILKELFEDIDDLAGKEYAGLDDQLLKKLEQIEFEVLKEPGIEFEAVNFLFLPEDTAKLEKVLDNISAVYETESIYVLRLRDYETFKEAVVKSKKLNNIRHNGFALIKAFEDITEYYAHLAANDESNPGNS